MRALRPTGRTIYFFGALGGVLFGYDTGVISGALLFIPNTFKLTTFLQGAIVSGLLLANVPGVLASWQAQGFYLAERIDLEGWASLRLRR